MSSLPLPTASGGLEQRRAPAPALEYEPALDGLRGASLLAVMLFHSGFAWATGGFLGVSTFFTLSGFLITTLLLAEREATGRVSLRSFWERRLRRLMPAALVTLVAVVATAPWWLAPGPHERLADDAVASLLWLVNWRFLGPQYAYDLLFIDPSPLQHVWSLAIEAQFYLVFPLVLALVLGRGGRRALAIVCVALCAASVAVCLAVPIDEAQHRLYYATDARCAELLVGALLAIVLRHARDRSWWPRPLVLSGLGIAAAIGILLVWALADVADGWLYRGGFLAYALLSALVLASALQPGSAVRAALSPAWLRGMGKVSYGAYLFHWPIFLVLTAERTGLGGPALLLARFALTFALAGASYRWLERPVRRGIALPGRRFGLVMAGSAAAVAVLAVLVSPLSLAQRAEIAGNEVRRVLGGSDGVLYEHPSFAMFGDSSAFSLWNGLGPWIRREARVQATQGWTPLGCGLFAYGEMEKFGRWVPEREECRGMTERWRTSALERRPDVALVLVGPWEVRNRRAGPDQPRRALGDPVLDAATRDAMLAAVDALASVGTSTIFLTAPHILISPSKEHYSDAEREASDPRRMDRLNELIQDVARLRPDRVRVVDLAGYLRRRPSGEFDTSVRHDNVHYLAPAARNLAREWLGPEVLRVGRELHDARVD